MEEPEDHFGERVAATYDELADVFEPGAVNATLGLLAELAGSGRVLELGIATQAMRGHYVDFADAHGEYSTIPFRYVWPAELDLMARLAGMQLRERWGGWAREPFTGESRQHISVWVKPAG
jgi:hypothetical protein